MKSTWSCARLFLFAFFLMVPVFSGGLYAADTPAARGGAWIIPIRGDIEPSLAVFVRREGRRAEAAGADFIIFEIDTFGGRVDTALQITSFIMSIKNARTIAWVNFGASGDDGTASLGVSWSAGALIALACADIYMAEGTSIGAAAPVTAGPGGEMEAAGEKTVAAVRSQMAALAERNGHPIGIALAMVDMDVELVEVSVNGETRALTAEEADRLGKDTAGGRAVISAKGKLLSLTSGEAVRYGLAKGLADDRAGLLGRIGAAEVAGESVPGLSDSIVSVLTSASVQTILILLALVMVFLEINTPGFGIPGVTAIIAFALVFGSSALLGRVDSLEIVLFLLGIGLLAVELFIIPGFGLVGISGFILIGLSLVLSMQDFVIPRIDWEWNLLGRNAAVVFIGLIAAIVGIAIIALLGPRIRLFDRFTLQTRISDTSGGHGIPDEDAKKSAVQSVASDYQRLVGKTGVAATVLRPSGFIEIEDEVFSAEAEGSFVDPGRGVKVTKVNGNRITVRLV